MASSLLVEPAPESSDRCRFCFQELCGDCEGCLGGSPHTECAPCVCEEPERENYVEPICQDCGHDYDDCICEWDCNGFGWGWGD